MEFPKDPKPTPEEMVRTYEETCAKGLNISLEEAKKRIYACSTTTYQGFQAIMTEEESEKFQGIPGVVFILPDSHIDPQNKEYGGDKYINGTIIPRPPPIQHHTEGRFRDRNRNYDRRRDVNFGAPHSQQGGPMQNQQTWPGNPQQNQQTWPDHFLSLIRKLKEMKREFISRCNFEIKLFFHGLPILLLVIRNQHFNPTQELSKLRKSIA